MGQKSLSPYHYSSPFIEDFTSSYKFVNEKHHPLYGSMQLWKSNDDETKVFIISKNVKNEIDKELYYQEVNTRLNFEHPNLHKLLGWKRALPEKLCEHSEKYDLYLPFFERNLAFELNRRSENKEFYNESELVYIAGSLINFSTYLQKHDICHGDFHAETVYLREDNAAATIILLDNGLVSLYRNGYERALSGFSEFNAYLTSFLLEALSRKETRPVYNVYAADMFAIAMILLYASTLKNPQYFYYNWSKYEINRFVIETDLKELEIRYSVNYAMLLRKMFNFEEENFSFIDLSVYLLNYSRKPLPLVLSTPEPPVLRPIQTEFYNSYSSVGIRPLISPAKAEFQPRLLYSSPQKLVTHFENIQTNPIIIRASPQKFISRIETTQKNPILRPLEFSPSKNYIYNQTIPIIKPLETVVNPIIRPVLSDSFIRGTETIVRPSEIIMNPQNRPIEYNSGPINNVQAYQWNSPTGGTLSSGFVMTSPAKLREPYILGDDRERQTMELALEKGVRETAEQTRIREVGYDGYYNFENEGYGSSERK